MADRLLGSSRADTLGGKPVSKLDFSGRARRRSRKARLALAAWAVSTLATLLGLPTGGQVLARVLDDGGGPAGAASTSTVVLVRWHRDDARDRAQKARIEAAAVSTTEKLRRADVRPEERREERRKRARRQRRREQRRAERAQEQEEQEQQESQEEAQRATEAAPPDSITGIIYEAAADAGIEGDYLLSVAYCESDLDPGAVNAAGYYGLFQFDEPTWAEFGYGSIWDPVAQAQTAARMLAAGMYDRWPNCA
jgi:soluble lytic murein transglycosylase-like protein